MLQGAAATSTSMRTGFGPTLRTGLEHALAARFDDLTAPSQHARLDLFASQRAFDEPGAPLDEGNAAPIIGQSHDNQALPLADRNLGPVLAARKSAGEGKSWSRRQNIGGGRHTKKKQKK